MNDIDLTDPATEAMPVPHRVRARQRAQESWTRWRIAFPASAAFYDATWTAIWDGRLQREPCAAADCGEIGSPVFDWQAQTIASWACRKHRHSVKRDVGRAARQ